MKPDELTENERALSDRALAWIDAATANGKPTVEAFFECMGRALAKRLRLAEAALAPKPQPDPFHRNRPAVALPHADWLELTAEGSRLKLVAGDVVAVEMDDGSVRQFIVMHCAWQLGHGSWVIRLDGIPGGYDLSRVRAVKRRAA